MLGKCVVYCAAFKEIINVYGLLLGGILGIQYTIEYPININSLVLIAIQCTMPKKLLKFQNINFHIMPNYIFKKNELNKKEFIGICNFLMNINLYDDLKNIHYLILVI